MCFFFFSSRRRHTRYWRDWSSDVCSSDLELNVTLPLMARNVLESIRLLTNVSRILADRCVDGIIANVDRCREYAERSEEHTSELKSRQYLVCRRLLEKKQ